MNTIAIMIATTAALMPDTQTHPYSTLKMSSVGRPPRTLIGGAMFSLFAQRRVRPALLAMLLAVAGTNRTRPLLGHPVRLKVRRN